MWVLGLLVTAFIAFSVSGPDVHPLTVFITCANCDNANDIRAPQTRVEANTGATFTLAVENSGSMGTTLVEHNVTFRGALESQTVDQISFVEDPDDNDRVQVPIGSHSKVYLTLNRNEGVVYLMRHGSPISSSIAPIVRDVPYIYGHLTYRRSIGIPTTTYFCFRYFSPTKGLPEGWTVCGNDIIARIEVARSR